MVFVACCRGIELTKILCGRMNEREKERDNYNGCDIKQRMNLTL